MNPLEHIQASILRRRLRMPIWLLLAGLVLAMNAFGWAGKGYWTLLLWLAALAVSVVGAGLAFVRVRPSADDAARQLDAELDAKNRFEAAAELAGNASPLAEAQRTETQHHYADLKPIRLLTLPIMLALVFLLVTNLGFLIGWVVTMPSFEPLPELAELPPEASAPLASIEWIEPEPEITATPLEVLPLTANVMSTSGLENMELVIAVNGQEIDRQPIETDFFEPGNSTLEIDLYLDLLEIEPYDMVTYYLQSQRIFERDLPPTVSGLQFVQIRPFRDDVGRMKMMGRGDAMEDIAGVIKKIKIAQLRLFKQNFLLAHADRENEVWPVENEKVGTEQATLVEKTTEAIDLLTAMGSPAVIVDLLGQSKQPMITAADQIIAADNQAALPLQGQSLGMITEIEKFIQKMIIESEGGGGKQPPKIKDPFADQEEYHLPPRDQTPAGQLEELAREQRELLEKMNEARPEEAAEQQEEIAEKLSELTQDSALSPEVAENLEAAAKDANASQQQLVAGDKTAAREPAARALASIEEAMRDMRQNAQAEAEALLAEAQRALSDAARAKENSEAGEAKSDGEAPIELAANGIQPGEAEGEGTGKSQSEASAHAGDGKQASESKSSSESVQASSSEPGQSPSNGEGGEGEGEGNGEGESTMVSQGEGKGKGLNGQGQGQGSQSNSDSFNNNPQFSPEITDGRSGRNGMTDVVQDENKYLRSAEAAALARLALRDEALRQQQYGSQELALMLAKLAEKMSDDIAKLEAGQDPSTTLAKLSDQMAEALIAIEERRLAMTLARDQLKRAAASLQRLSNKSTAHEAALDETTGDVLAAAQITRLLLQEPQSDAAYTKLWNDLAVNEPVVGGHYMAAAQPIDVLIALLDEQLANLTRKSIISLGNVDTAPEGYREALSAYFERLANTPAESP